MASFSPSIAIRCQINPPMLWRGSVLFHPLYDPELRMYNQDLFLNLCEALQLECVGNNT